MKPWHNMVAVWPLRIETYKSSTPVTYLSRWLAHTHTDTRTHTINALLQYWLAMQSYIIVFIKQKSLFHFSQVLA